jgi:hypothetical protein
MRDIFRIAKFLDKFEELWKSAPDLRFIQVVASIQIQAKQKFGIDDLFYIEEDKLLEIMNDIIENGEIN